MGIREERKRETRHNILNTTRELLFKNGFVKVSTKEISTTAGVAQGSIFLHFGNKDNLLHEIITQDIIKLNESIKNDVDVKTDRETFLKQFLDCLASNENMLSRIYKDYYYLNDSIKKSIDNVETTLKNMIFDNVRNTPGKLLSIVDSFIAIDAFYSQIVSNLSSKEVYNDLNSVIRQTRGKLTKLYRSLFE